MIFCALTLIEKYFIVEKSRKGFFKSARRFSQRLTSLWLATDSLEIYW